MIRVWLEQLTSTDVIADDAFCKDGKCTKKRPKTIKEKIKGEGKEPSRKCEMTPRPTNKKDKTNKLKSLIG